ALSAVLENGLANRVGPPVVQKAPLEADAPQRRSAPLTSASGAADDAIGQIGSHVVQQQIRIKVYRLVLESFDANVLQFGEGAVRVRNRYIGGGVQARRVANRAAQAHEDLFSALSFRVEGSPGRWCEQRLEGSQHNEGAPAVIRLRRKIAAQALGELRRI